MKCHKCTRAIEPGWVYCPHCGTKTGSANLGNAVSKDVPPPTVDCPNCKATNNVHNHFCVVCGSDLSSQVFALYQQVDKEYIRATKEFEAATQGNDQLAIEREQQNVDAAYERERAVFAAFSALTKDDYRTATKNFLIVSLVCLPIQLGILYVLVQLRTHNPSRAHTIFVDGILLSGIANVVSCLTVLWMILHTKLKGDA